MAKSDRDRTGGAKTGDIRANMLDRDVAAKAVLDNMARLKALRLAREAAEPPRPPASPKKASASAKSKKSEEKAPALGEWLAGQQSGGRRT
jgi:hypothetical protein